MPIFRRVNMSKELKFEQKTVKVGKEEYTLQKPKIQERIKIRSRILNAGELSQFVAYEEYLSKVVVSPKKSMDDFENDLPLLDKLMVEVEQFLYSDTSVGK